MAFGDRSMADGSGIASPAERGEDWPDPGKRGQPRSPPVNPRHGFPTANIVIGSLCPVCLTHHRSWQCPLLNGDD